MKLAALPVLLVFIATAPAYAKKNGHMKESGLEIQQLLFGGIVKNGDLALKLAEIIIADIYGKEEVELQKPFTVIENDGVWTIEGSKNSHKNIEGDGWVAIKIARDDARVIDIKRYFIMIN